MKFVPPYYWLLYLIILLTACSDTQSIPEPETFLPGLVSTDAVEYGITFTPSGDSCFFVRHTGEWGRSNNPPANIYLLTFQNGNWSAPSLANFSTLATNDDDIFISPDGKTMLFTSNRDYPGKPGKGSDIWKLEKINGKWSAPFPLDSLINSPNMESSPVTTRTGDLYFTSIREEGAGQGDIYLARIKPDGTYEHPELVPVVNSEQGEWNLFVEPDGKWIIFESSGRPEGKSGYGDLYFSKKKEGVWQEPVAMVDINTTGSDLNVRLGPEGEYLYYACSFTLENTDVDIMRISFRDILKRLEAQ